MRLSRSKLARLAALGGDSGTTRISTRPMSPPATARSTQAQTGRRARAGSTDVSEELVAGAVSAISPDTAAAAARPARSAMRHEGDRLDAVAIRIADVRGIVGVARLVMRALARRPGVRAPEFQRGRVERIHRGGAPRAQARVRARPGVPRTQPGPLIDPEIRIALAETDGALALDKARVAESPE